MARRISEALNRDKEGGIASTGNTYDGRGDHDWPLKALLTNAFLTGVRMRLSWLVCWWWDIFHLQYIGCYFLPVGISVVGLP